MQVQDSVLVHLLRRRQICEWIGSSWDICWENVICHYPAHDFPKCRVKRCWLRNICWRYCFPLFFLLILWIHGDKKKKMQSEFQSRMFFATWWNHQMCFIKELWFEQNLISAFLLRIKFSVLNDPLLTNMVTAEVICITQDNIVFTWFWQP